LTETLDDGYPESLSIQYWKTEACAKRRRAGLDEVSASRFRHFLEL